MASNPAQATYRALVEQMWSDGRIVPEEVTTLTTMQSQLGISPEDAAIVEREVMGQTKEEALVAGMGTNVPRSAPVDTKSTPSPESSEVVGTFSGGRTLVNSPDEQNGPRTLSDRSTMAGSGARSVGSGQLQPGDLVADRFEVLGVLGEGGMGQVLKVRDTKLDAVRAMKVVRPELLHREDILERFRDEVTTSQKLAHPNIVRVFDYGEDAPRGIRFLTMEFIDGVTLRKWLKQKVAKNVPVKLNEFMAIAKGLCEALSNAHTVTVHRDLKPENIMIDRASRGIKLMDFGIAKAFVGSKQYMTAGPMGTVYYVAPEQESHGTVDCRADIYSTGVILYEMLAGEIPRAGSKKISELRPDVPASIGMALAKAMATDPKARFATATELLEAVSKREEKEAGAYALAGETAPPPPQGAATAAEVVETGHAMSEFDIGFVQASEKDDEECKRMCEQAASRVWGDIDQARKHFVGLSQQQDQPLTQSEVLAAIEAINNWGNKKTAYIKQLGDKIVITKALRSEVIIGQLDLLVFHQRGVIEAVRQPREEPGTMETASKAFARAVSSTSISDPPDSFVEKRLKDQAVPGSVFGQTCGSCGGEAQAVCGACQGAGSGVCGKCGGQGQYVKDTTSFVDKFMNEIDDVKAAGGGYSYNRAYRANRAAMRANQKIANTQAVTCEDCGGVGQCGCSTCEGTGTLLCSTCDGSGIVLQRLCLRSRFQPHGLTLVTPATGVPQDRLLRETSKVEVYDRVISPISTQSTAQRGSAPAAIAPWVGGVTSRINELAAAGEFVPVPIRAQIRVEKCTVETIEYEYDGHGFCLYLLGKDRTVYAEKTPSRSGALLKGVGGLFRKMRDSMKEDPMHRVARQGERRTPGGALVFAGDLDMRLANWLESRNCKFETTATGYTAKVEARRKLARLTFVLDGEWINIRGMLVEADRGKYRAALRLCHQVPSGGIGLVDTNKGLWFCMSRSLYYMTASENEISGAIAETVLMVHAIRPKLKN